MKVQYVGIVQRSAWLNTEFGLSLACKKLNKTPEEIEALVGRYTKGKRKGDLRGQLIWWSVIQPGWVRRGFYDHDAMQAKAALAREEVAVAGDACVLEGSWGVDSLLPHRMASVTMTLVFFLY